MINQKCFTKEWLTTVNQNLGWNRGENQLKNLEKAIVALHLVEEMTKTSLRFIFKGGTSLLLLLGKIQRLSVDVDLILESNDFDIAIILQKIATKSDIFYHVEKKEHKSFDGLSHYYFYYRPFANNTDESYILLDLYSTKNPYNNVVETKIESEIIETNGDSFVRTPDIECGEWMMNVFDIYCFNFLGVAF